MDLHTAFRLLLVAFIATAVLSGLLRVFRKKLMSSTKNWCSRSKGSGIG